MSQRSTTQSGTTTGNTTSGDFSKHSGQAQEHLREGTKRAGEAVSHASSAASEGLSGVQSAAYQGVQGITDTVKNLGQSAYNVGQEYGHAITGSGQETGSSGGGGMQGYSAQDMYKSGRETAGKVGDTMSQRMGGAQTSGQGGFSGLENTSFGPDAVRRTMTQTREGISARTGKMNEAYTRGAHYGAQTVQSGVQTVAMGVGAVVGSATEMAKETFSGVLGVFGMGGTQHSGGEHYYEKHEEMRK
ncbi:hypothetical protein HK098_000845 [Nowakowskiella sp. JEL0407]|nr:hypothetical protein HK098_000845 [Nowakowskiella sp. JEL0407]